MSQVHLLLAATPPILRDLVKALAAQTPGLEIVGQVGPQADLAAAIGRRRVDVVMLGGGQPAGDVHRHLLRVYPELRLLTVAEGGRVCHVDRLRPHRTTAKDISPGELIDAVLGKGRFT